MEEYANAHQGYILKPPPPTQRTPGRWRKIYWIGLGSKTSGLHTRKEFLQIMLRQYPEKRYWRMKGDRVIPLNKIKRNDIDGWMGFAEAVYV